MLGLKTAKGLYTLGSKLHTLYTLGNTLNNVRKAVNNIKTTSVSPDKGVGVNNMIYNKSNISDIEYIPFGVRKLANEPKKKSYLEKR